MDFWLSLMFPQSLSPLAQPRAEKLVSPGLGLVGSGRVWVWVWSQPSSNVWLRLSQPNVASYAYRGICIQEIQFNLGVVDKYGFLTELDVPTKFQPSSTAQSWKISKSRSGRAGSGQVGSQLVSTQF